MQIRSMLTGACVALSLCFGTGAQAQGGDVITLQSFDGFTQLRGKLLEFDGNRYTIETILGVIQVDALQVNCEGEACPEAVLFGAEFGVHGSNTVGAQLMPALIEGYADQLDATLVTEVGQSPMDRMLRIVTADGREMAAIELQSRGSGSAYQGLGSGTAELGMSSRRLRDQDLAALATAGIPDLRDGPNEHVLALDGLIVIVHPSNPIRSISLEELALIFSGGVSNWSQLGGADAPVSLYALEEPSGTYQTFESLVLSPYDLEIVGSAQRFASNVRLSDSVASDPNAIGVTAVAFQRASKALPIRQDCGILSFPTTFAMKTEEYPLARRLYLYDTPNNVSGHARQLLEFAKSEEAQPIIAEAGFVNLSVELLPLEQEGARIIHALVGEDEIELNLFREMLRELRNASRLSTTFRFTPGSSQLTPKSQADVRRLATDIASGLYAGKEVLLIGFTDSVGQFALNRGLSVRRADVVLNQLLTAVPPGTLDDISVQVQGYGELMPVGCNSTLQGRTANRRVEVWIRDRS